MKTRHILEKDSVNEHLGSHKWIEVFPDASRPLEIFALKSLPKDAVSWSAVCEPSGQSPLLVRLDVFNGKFKSDSEQGDKPKRDAEGPEPKPNSVRRNHR